MNRAVPLLVASVLAVGRVAAHGGHGAHDGGASLHPAVPASVFFGSALVLGTAVYLDHAGQLPRRMADAAVALGVVGLLAAIALLFV